MYDPLEENHPPNAACVYTARLQLGFKSALCSESQRDGEEFPRVARPRISNQVLLLATVEFMRSIPCALAQKY
jgi:hypothetical protein